MENKLEQLLNSLIQRGWKPFGEGCHRSPYKRVGIHKNYNKERIYVLFYSNNHSHWKVLRQVVSKESGLWQFVCKNGMVDDGVEYKGYALVDVDGGAIAKYETGCRYLYSNIEPEFYIMESALCDESELESFILDNIKVGNI